ncbi:MAG: Rad3-related DNA helicase [halophilic archaeon J07HB67]|nr:MAG: Rad3-related DNA helicase [halophilic archaeon J07HB67]
MLARAVAGAARTTAEAEPAEPTGAYYTTPQVSQLEDVATDDLLDDLQVIRGKSNYTCILPGEETTPVNRAPCARERGYDCSVRHRCPYYSARAVAANREIAATTLAYFMRTAGSELFRQRDVVVIDEAHGLAEWAEMYATIDLSPRTLPVWEDLRVPNVRDADDTLTQTVRFAESVVGACDRALEELRGRQELSPREASRRDRLAERKSELAWFVRDARDPESATTWVVDQPDGAGGGISVVPLEPARYLRHTVWDRGQKFALLSATILDKRSFCRGVGLDPADVALVEVGHTFPVENRPLFDTTRGKMTYDHRDETTPAVARLCVRLMAAHPDQKGLIHAHSYDIARRLADRFADAGVGPRVRTHGREDRDRQLERWLAADDPEVFVSVKMEEALDLAGDLCRWQVLCKAPYANTNDSRVARRLADDQWGWYYRTALRTVIQACGRVVRSPDDYGATYLADSSLLELFDRAATDVPPWFQDQIDRVSTPSLPAFDPEAALAGHPAPPAAGQSPRGGVGETGERGSDESESDTGGSSRASAGGAANEADGGSEESDDRDDHPLSDVWG